MTPTQVVSIAKISQYLWDCSIPRQNVFFNGSIDPRKAQQLYMEIAALEYGLEQGLSSIEGVSNYVLALCGAKLQTAQEIYETGSSGGSVVPGGNTNTDRTYAVYGTPGATSVTFPAGAINGQILTATRGGIEVGEFSSLPTPIGNDVFWNPATATLTVAADVPFVSEELIRILVK